MSLLKELVCRFCPMTSKATFAILGIAAVLVLIVASTLSSSAMAVSDNFSRTGNPHDTPGAGDGNPHKGQDTGNPHRCPGANCSD
jgi:hypothetical protein